MENMAAALMGDPEVMALMQKPGVMAKLQQIMANPGDQALLQRLVLGDPDMMRILSKLQGMQGGGGGGGMAGMPPAAAGVAPPSVATATGDLVQVRSKAQFDQLVASSRLVVVDFFATWCGPCKRIAPAFAAMAGEYAGRATFAKVDGDQCRDVTAACGVRSYPTFHLYKNGAVVAQFSGANEAELRRLVEQHASPAEAACPYRHFPLGDETVTYAKCKFDAVRGLVERHCAELAGRAGAEAPLDAAELAELDSLAAVLGDARGFHTSAVSAAQLAVVDRLLAWPAAMAAPGLHYARMLALHPATAEVFARRVASEAGQPGDLVARIGGLAAAAAKPAYAMLALRALVNFFGRRVLARALGARAEDLFNALAPLSESQDAKVRLDYVVLMLNFTILLRDVPSLAEHKVQVLSTVAELLTQENDDKTLYRLLVVLGSLVYRDADTAELAAGFELGDAVAAAAAASEDARVAECADEIGRALADPSA